MTDDEFNRILNKKAADFHWPRTPAEAAGAWQAVMDRPPLHDGDDEYYLERRWFIDTWFDAIEHVLNHQNRES